MSERLLYVAATVAYIVLGVFVPALLLTWPVGVAYLLVTVWLVPALVRRAR
jgi:hypothetical protein